MHVLSSLSDLAGFPSDLKIYDESICRCWARSCSMPYCRASINERDSNANCPCMQQFKHLFLGLSHSFGCWQLQEWMKNVTAGKMSKSDKLGQVDHSTMNYPPFRRSFYIEAQELRSMTEKEVADYRMQLEDIKVRGKDVPRPRQKLESVWVEQQSHGCLEKVSLHHTNANSGSSSFISLTQPSWISIDVLLAIKSVLIMLLTHQVWLKECYDYWRSNDWLLVTACY